jgi:hypothetical protein
MKKIQALLCLVALALALPLAAAPKKLLVVTVTTGFRHSVIPVSEKIMEQLAAQSGGAFTVEFIHQPAGEPKAPGKPKVGKDGEQAPAFVEAMAKWKEADAVYRAARPAWMKTVAEALKPLAPANLKKYDGVIFASTTGDDLPLPDPQGAKFPVHLEQLRLRDRALTIEDHERVTHGKPQHIRAVMGVRLVELGPPGSPLCWGKIESVRRHTVVTLGNRYSSSHA